MCYRCFKPAPDCVCADVIMVDNRTGVIILQHVRERNHPFGTARFAQLGLRQIDLRVCNPNDCEAMARVSSFPPNTALLYPSPGAREIGTLPPSDRPAHLVVVDATWHHAKTVIREAPSLRSLPRVCLAPVAPSDYRVRRQPRANCLATIEATVAALRALEPETPGFDGLLDAFTTMVDRQLVRIQEAPVRRARAPRARPARIPLPSVFKTDYSRLVLAYGEIPKSSYGAPPEVVYWCAVRPATGERFERFVRPVHGPPSPVHLAHMGLTTAQIDGGLTGQDFRDEWSSFLGPDDVVTAWNWPSLKCADAPNELLLKGAACNLIGRSCGHLDEFIRDAGLTPVETSFSGRAGEHMGRVLAVVEHMRRLALAPSGEG